jgi:hypothetical protein
VDISWDPLSAGIVPAGQELYQTAQEMSSEDPFDTAIPATFFPVGFI